ncbi:MAG TPA: hypothetical protein VFD17_00120 [Clostridia bacterium]|nr:hypothetical protein [Clostridia bacterium]
MPFDERKCRVCGCTDNCACPGGCYWVDINLCSRCAEKMENEERQGGVKICHSDEEKK